MNSLLSIILRFAIRSCTLALPAISFCLCAVSAQAQMRMPGQEAPEPQPLPHPDLPIVPPAPVYPSVWAVLLAAVVLLIFVALGIWLWKNRPRAAVEGLERKARRRALAALRELQNQVLHLPPAESAHQLSVITRRYVTERYRVPVLNWTLPEWLQRHLRSAPPGQRAAVLGRRLVPLAETWDELAFAPKPGSAEEVARLIDQARVQLEEDQE